MIKIEFVRSSRSAHLIRPDTDEGWLQTPVGFPVRSGGGPANTTCATCIHLLLAESRWSDRGRAAPCGERRRLSVKKAQEVPIRWPSCSLYQARPDAEAALAAADTVVDGQIVERNEKIQRCEQAAKRLRDEVKELMLLRQDPGFDASWAGFEPAESGG